MMTIKDLRNLKEILNLKAMTEKANLSYNAINSKIAKQNELTVTQSMKLMQIFRAYGLEFINNPEQKEKLFS